jgi:hypothetical protein
MIATVCFNPPGSCDLARVSFVDILHAGRRRAALSYREELRNSGGIHLNTFPNATSMWVILAIGYARVSTERQAEKGMSLESAVRQNFAQWRRSRGPNCGHPGGRRRFRQVHPRPRRPRSPPRPTSPPPTRPLTASRSKHRKTPPPRRRARPRARRQPRRTPHQGRIASMAHRNCFTVVSVFARRYIPTATLHW